MVQDAAKVCQYFIYDFAGNLYEFSKNAKEVIKQLLTALDTSVIKETKKQLLSLCWMMHIPY